MLFLSRRSTYFRAVCALALVLLPLALGGGGDPLVTVVVTCATGLFCVAVPAGARLGRPSLTVFLALAVLPLLALLPLGFLYAHSAWRMAMDGQGFLSPLIASQPKALLRILPLYYAGLAFAAWAVRADWEPVERRFLEVGLEAGFAAVLGLALLSRFAHIPLPFWHPDNGLGPFPARNQTGLFLAMGFVWSLPLISASRAERRRAIAVSWLALGSAFVYAAVINGSRAGVGFCVLGAVLHIGLAGFTSRRAGIVVLAGVLLFSSLFLVAFYYYDNAAVPWLDPLLHRDGMVHEFRARVHEDTWDMIREFPWTGVGLGNYDAVFPFYRSHSAMDFRVLHAESDWLHFAAECGLVALAVVAAGLLSLFVHTGREVFTRNRYGFIRAGFVIMVMAVVHGFFDQSLHNAGIVFPALLIVSLSLRPAREMRIPPRVGWHGLAAGAALLALGLLSAGWIDAARLQGSPLGGYRVAGPLKTSMPAVDSALSYAPLSWSLHEMRARLLLDQGKDTEALSEFRLARLLEPFSLVLALRESNAWIDAGKLPPSMESARQAVLRAAPARQGPIYGEYLSRYSLSHQARELWLGWAPSGDMQLNIIRISFLPPDKVCDALDKVVSEGGTGAALSPDAERRLIELELQRGSAGLDTLQRAGFRFSDAVWIAAARELAGQSHADEACEIVIAKLDPTDDRNSPPEKALLEREYFTAPDDWHRAVRLADVYLIEGSALSAERVIDHLPGGGNGVPGVNFYRGWIARLKGDNTLAWVCFTKYISEKQVASP